MIKFASGLNKFANIFTERDSNPFHDFGLFLYPLKVPENQSFSNVFREYRKRLVALYGLVRVSGSYL